MVDSSAASRDFRALVVLILHCVVSCRGSGGDGGKESQLRGMLSAGLITQAEFEQNLATLQR